MSITVIPATEKQRNYADALITERVPSHEQQIWRNIAGGCGKADMSKVIDALRKRAPIIASPAAVPGPRKGGIDPAIPGAHYAIPHPDTGQLDFFEVKRPKSGKWAGYTFVSRLVGAPGDYTRYRLSATQQETLSRLLLADTITTDDSRELAGPEAGAYRYAREHRVCAVCNAALTDPESRARGLGPVCASRF